MNDNTRTSIESLEEYKDGLLRSIAVAIKTTNGNDDYSIGLRNGLRICKAYIDGLEPEYEKCKLSASPNCSDFPRGGIKMTNKDKFIEIFGIDTWRHIIFFSGVADRFKEFWANPYKLKEESK